ncbi:amino acid transporter protein [Hansschlegelia plantiphila]|nr:amino acid transporter protein [Hansschlegelia plantiphila]
MTTLDEDARAKLVENERIKLSAAFLNGAAVAIFAVGSFAPMVTAMAQQHSGLFPFVIGLVSLIFSIYTHFQARRTLRDLKP